jgi:tRNA pseudouridine55 synthase
MRKKRLALIMNPPEGILLINKPKGKTAFSLVKTLRGITGVRKIGHAGTLDPFATGVMVLLVGKSFTRLSDRFLTQGKEYFGRITLGYSTDTYDCDGTLTPGDDRIPSKEEIEEVIATFQGTMMQTPPMYSAKKVGGKKLYELARKGIEIPREPNKVELTTTLLAYDYPTIDVHIKCSKGTYIRSVAFELGEKLGTGAYLSELKRLASGPFRIEECVEYNDLIGPGFEYARHLLKEGVS